MNILIVGGLGFIGRHLTISLLCSGHKVTIVDKQKIPIETQLIYFNNNIDILNISSEQFFTELLLEKHIPILQDLTFDDHIPFDVIFDLASKNPISNVNIHSCISNNIGSCLSILSYCEKYPQTKYIYISDIMVKNQNEIINNPYLLSKKICENCILSYKSLHKINATIIRLGSVFGPSESKISEIYNNSISQICKDAIWNNKKTILVKEHPDTIKEFIHVYDVADALIKLSLENHLNDYYEIGSNFILLRIKDVVDEFLKDIEINVVYNTPKEEQFDFVTVANLELVPVFWYPKYNIIDYITSWKEDGCPH